jgi:predicted PurR-regulated permease PerM
VSDWAVGALIVMAIALVVMATGQVVLALAAARLARQTGETVQQFRRDIQPIMEKAQKIAEDASKTTSIALQQAQKISQLMDTTGRQVEQTMTILQDAVLGPVRHGTAVLAGVRAALEFFRNSSARSRRARREESEDALFIG